MKSFFRVILNILKWGLRIIMFLAGQSTMVIMEIIFTAVGLLRFEKDEIFKVVTGFVGDDEIGYFGSTDNRGNRFFGWCGYILAIIFRIGYILILFGAL